MKNTERDRYEILRALAAAGSSDSQLDQVGQVALEQTAGLIGLDAVSLYLWNEDRQVTLHLSHAQDEDQAARLAELEANLFDGLRRNHQLMSAHMSFTGDEPYHSFTMPLKRGSQVFGAVIGLQFGERRTILEDEFLDALTGTLGLHAMVAGMGGTPTEDQIEAWRFDGVKDTAVTVNDKINNALQAIMGTVQLLKLHRDDLDEEVQDQLAVILKSAAKIKRVTKALLTLESAKTVEYTSGIKMIDLPGIDDDPDQDDEPKADS